MNSQVYKHKEEKEYNEIDSVRRKEISAKLLKCFMGDNFRRGRRMRQEEETKGNEKKRENNMQNKAE